MSWVYDPKQWGRKSAGVLSQIRAQLRNALDFADIIGQLASSDAAGGVYE